jgi:hypothetical protein
MVLEKKPLPEMYTVAAKNLCLILYLDTSGNDPR